MLEDWPRKNFQEGPQHPFLFYVVFGAVDLDAPVSRGTYRTNGIADGLEIMHYSAASQPEVLANFKNGYLWENFMRRYPDLASHVSSSTECAVLRGEPENDADLNYLRDTIGLLTHYLDQGGLCVYDPQMFHWWDPPAWRERLFTPAQAVRATTPSS